MWLIDSSIGRKVVMSVTGAALILFLTFHMAMNCVALISGDAYNAICEFLGANWYALVGTVGLAVLVLIHFVYAFWLTLLNRKARGRERYAVNKRYDTVEWASQNMFVLGIIVVLGLCLHLFNFWYKMQLQEILGTTAVINGQSISPTDGAFLIRYTFSQWYYVLAYVVWLAALWFHLSHGFWSMFHSVGWSGSKWLGRWQVIGNIYVTLLVLGFLSVVLFYFFKSIF
ncbi:MAG TPA: succinate dehydrogenase/fumarate reductase cytochrome b subunit [Bacteroidaceae bacterium]|jgi:succinate dehydrogenase / fumarate reductase cytochrome b subunit|nr:succinate dehydrogenase/fumarate reductase cytochrome b subunit [Bacteroidaceae bacterium]MBP8603358.1 succinate dehydrogenase/fumarate reductase cytochrome b subunit [Bacteroidaceae bacterium]HOD68017.1 succinate dehydrogenase/fumarate reductase cytochrome b subunit [Bacteroidaceae bacterium]HPB03468.1 succinate dehydrogenase/fumarate reductase cytochrome b subunit [Bacteroidaceae bacterium]HPX99596.1 succinate dehydrogenase/fumarate reductase cytochrome b subunit [Bacteroidaceae bacterium]